VPHAPEPDSGDAGDHGRVRRASLADPAGARAARGGPRARDPAAAGGAQPLLRPGARVEHREPERAGQHRSLPSTAPPVLRRSGRAGPGLVPGRPHVLSAHASRQVPPGGVRVVDGDPRPAAPVARGQPPDARAADRARAHEDPPGAPARVSRRAPRLRRRFLLSAPHHRGTLRDGPGEPPRARPGLRPGAGTRSNAGPPAPER
jgi:hypothetical protein